MTGRMADALRSIGAPRWLVPAAILVAALQIGLLAWAIQGRASILRNGAEVVLRVEPVDPRDLLRGDYVRLGYNISRIPSEKVLPPSRDDDAGRRTIWVLLAPGPGGFHEVEAAAFDRAALPAGEGRVTIRGTTGSRLESGGELLVDYGIERFYLPEGEGREIEQDIRERSFTMKVAVSAAGIAQIRSFHDGDRMLYAEPLY